MRLVNCLASIGIVYYNWRIEKLGINPPGFHNWTQDEYTEHIQYLDDLEGY